MRSSLRVVCCLCLAAPLFGAIGAAAASAQTFSDAADVIAVEVPVQVLRDGEPVRGLTAADFEVYEGRRKLPVTGFEVLDLSTAEAVPAREAPMQPARPIAARRHFLLLFDLGSSSPKALLQAQEAAQDLLDGLHPSDIVAVASYRPSKGPELLLGFATDRAQARTALGALAKPEMLNYRPDPLRLVLGSTGMGQSTGDGGNVSGGGPNGGERGSDKREAIAEAYTDPSATLVPTMVAEINRAERASQRRAVTAMSRAFADLAKTMGGLYGRKYVVLFSEGFDSSIYQGTANIDEQNIMAAESTRGVLWGIDSEQRFGNTGTANDLEKMLEEFRRADCVVQTVDIGGLRERGGPEAQFVGGRDSLFLIADSTGGELYENFNDLSAAMGQMLNRTSVTYVLAFQPEGLKRDGSYHRLRVELKNAPKGTRVVHRPGYYAPRPFGEQSATERMLQTAQQVIGGQENGAIPTSVLAAPFHVGSPQAYVPVLLEVDGPALLAGQPVGKPLPAEIYVYAMDRNGSVQDYFSQAVGLDLAKVEPAVRKSGLKFFGHLDLAPGDYSLRVLVRNGATGSTGIKVAALQVPAFSPADPVLLPAFFPEPAGKWLIVREAAQPGDRQVPYPFMAGEEPFIPASLPTVGPGEEARLALVGYHLREGNLQAEARILTAAGTEAAKGEVRVVERHGRGQDGADRLTAEFRAPRLQPGDYLLMITVVDPAGKSETSVTPFQVRRGGRSGAAGIGEIRPTR